MKSKIIAFIFLAASIALSSQFSKSEVLQDPAESYTSNQEYALTATLTSSSRLFESKEDLTSVIIVIPSGSLVKITGSDSTYYRVVFGEDEGYIFKKHATINQTPVVIEPVKKQEQAVNVQPVQKQDTRLFYLENKYGPNMAAKLYAGKIWRGMTAQMVRDSWGTPLKINKDMGSSVNREEWIYNKANLFIENNTLVDWGETKNN